MFLTSELLRAGPSIADDWWYGPINSPTASGIVVTPAEAVSSTVVYRCINLLASTVAKLPVKVRGRETKAAEETHPVARVLTRRPNRWQTPYQWRAMQMIHLGLRGNAYSEIVIDRSGQVSELVPIHPDRVSVDEIGDGDWRYKIRDPKSGRERVLLREQVLHLVGHAEALPFGISPIQAQREAIGAAVAAQRYAARVFKNNARPGGGYLKMAGQFKDAEARRRFMEEWHRGLTGENAHRTPVFENGMEYHELGMTNLDAQMIESRKYSDVDLCRIYGVPPHKVGVLDRATYSNMEQQNVEFFEEIHAIATNLEQSLQMQLMTEDEESRLYIQFELKGVLRADSKTRGAFYHDAIQDGWMTRNEVREREDMEPLDGLDEPLEPLNMARTNDRPASDSPADREQALLRSAASRAVTREVGGVRKIAEKSGVGAELTAFYERHAAYLADALACHLDDAQAWCDHRLGQLRPGDWSAVVDQWEIEGREALKGLM